MSLNVLEPPDLTHDFLCLPCIHLQMFMTLHLRSQLFQSLHAPVDNVSIRWGGDLENYIVVLVFKESWCRVGHLRLIIRNQLVVVYAPAE